AQRRRREGGHTQRRRVEFIAGGAQVGDVEAVAQVFPRPQLPWGGEVSPDDDDAGSRDAHEPANLTAPRAAPLVDRPSVGRQGAGGGSPPAEALRALPPTLAQLCRQAPVADQPAHRGVDRLLIVRIEKEPRVAGNL